MSSIRGIGRMTVGEMREEIKRGARFVVFEYVISLIVITRRRASPIFFVRPGESTLARSWPYSLITLLLGWWSFPWGPAFTIGAIRDNLRGGQDVSARVVDHILDAADRQLKPQRPRQHRNK